MSRNWAEAVSDPGERRIFEALADPRWEFRTLSALARISGLTEEKVQELLARYPDLVRRSPIPDSKGRQLYTLASRRQTLKEWFNVTRAYITKTAG
jgi:hypothetical protein